MDEDRLSLEEFQVLSKSLRRLATEIPLHWGGVQNNRTDDNINRLAPTRN